MSDYRSVQTVREGLISKVLDRRDFSRMHGILTSKGWAHNGKTSRYKHATVPGTIALHTHPHGGAAWSHSGNDSNRGVKSLISHLANIHRVGEMTASAAIGTQSGGSGDPNWDDEDKEKKPATVIGNNGDASMDASESTEDIHRIMQLNYFSHAGTIRTEAEQVAQYTKIHPKDGSVEYVHIKILPNQMERWEHRHYGDTAKGNNADSLKKFLKGYMR